jgi:hypothetical protein
MRKKTPDTSKLSRTKPAPYTLRKPESSDTTVDVAKTDKPDKGPAKDAPKADVKAIASDAKVDAKFDDVKSGAMPVVDEDGAPKPGAGPKSATQNELPTEPVRARVAPSRERVATEAMPVVAPVGTPPEMPKAEPAPVAKTASTVEDPTSMPGPKAIPGGNPTDAAPAPGFVPPGDSRSLRRGDEFALIYRQSTFVISRFGVVGQRGQWRVVEYPTSAAASHSYAKECSRFVADGFVDYRG